VGENGKNIDGNVVKTLKIIVRNVVKFLENIDGNV